MARNDNCIWVIEWRTESGDRGILGYWKTRLYNNEQEKIMREYFPDEFRVWCINHGSRCAKHKCPYQKDYISVYWQLTKLEEKKQP